MSFNPKRVVYAFAAAAALVIGADVVYQHTDKTYQTCEQAQADFDKIIRPIDESNKTATEKTEATLSATFVAKNGQTCQIKSTTVYKKNVL